MALPAYSEYQTRSRVTEGLALASEAKVIVADSYTTAVELGAGIASYVGATSKYVTSVVVAANGMITITYNEANIGATDAVAGPTINLMPYVDGRVGGLQDIPTAHAANDTGPLDWGCASATAVVSTARGVITPAGTLPARFAPSECR